MGHFLPPPCVRPTHCNTCIWRPGSALGKADVPIEEDDAIICSLSDPPMEVNVNVVDR